LARKIAIALRRGFGRNFNAGGRPEPWQPLADSTLADKQRLFEMGAIRGRRQGIRVRLGPQGEQRGSLPGILMRSGLLKDSVVRAHTRGNIERFLNDGQEIVVGSSLAYADVHNKGGKGEYPIMPRNGKMLRFFGIQRSGPNAGQPGWIFARGVKNHPPMPRRPFLVIVNDTWEEIGELATDYLSLDGDRTPAIAES
jgi:phage gpG-like protein